MSEPAVAADVSRLLWAAIVFNKTDEAKRIIMRGGPSLDINFQNPDRAGMSFLHAAWCQDNLEIIELLLKHPGINVNITSETMPPPFNLVHHPNDKVFRLLLDDPRVDIDFCGWDRQTPIHILAKEGSVARIARMIATGKRFDPLRKYGLHGPNAIELARSKGSSSTGQAADLLEVYLRRPDNTRHETRIRLGHPEDCTAAIFALVIFFCDGLLCLVNDQHSRFSQDERNARKFFEIASRLPMELQAILCHRVMGSASCTETSSELKETAFRALAIRLSPIHVPGTYHHEFGLMAL